MIPRATYRLQFHRGFTFADAEAIVPYLADLGVSHVHASPIAAAAPGSPHGYDVVDPTRIDPRLGGEDGLGALVAALKARGMGLIVDIVPDRMSVAGDANASWNDVLEHGAASACARMFDIDWRAPVLLPVLAAPIANVVAAGDLRLVVRGDGLGLRLNGGAVYPVRPDDPALGVPRAQAIARHDPRGRDGRTALEALAARQHYRLTVWRAAIDVLNWRRFLASNDLAAVRVEDPEVFALTHRLTVELFRREWIDGVRIDHLDGLTDPADYCDRLRAALEAGSPARRAYIVAGKILAPDERLTGGWGIDGTDGTDFLREVNGLIHAPEGEAPLADLWHALSGRTRNFAEEACTARRETLTWQFEGQLRGCVEAFSALARASGREWVTEGMLRRAVEQLQWVLPVVRTYGNGTAAPPEDAGVRGTALAAARRLQPHGSKPFVGMVLDWLAGANGGEPALAREAVRRFQQLTPAIAVKGVEDCAFYRHGVLLSRNEIGCDPSLPSASIDDFHAAAGARAERLPHAMLATATHDNKRGADARARLAVVSAIPEAWGMHARRWLAHAAPHASGVHAADQYLALQALLGAWHEPPAGPCADLLARVQRWQVIALREAQLRSSWTEPDEGYEQRCRDLTAALLSGADGGAFAAEFGAFVAAIAPAARANTLAQAALHLTVPGVPDLYQGGELLDLGLVDSDERTPVDFARRAALLAGTDAAGRVDTDLDVVKLRLVAELLALRRDRPRLFAEGDYQPCRATGARARHVVAFERNAGGERLAVAVAIRLGRPLCKSRGAWLDRAWWGNTRIHFADGACEAAQVFGRSPVEVSAMRAQTPLRRSGTDARRDR